MNIQPFEVNIPQADLDDLARTAWPAHAGLMSFLASDGAAACRLCTCRSSTDYWQKGYDWRQ